MLGEGREDCFFWHENGSEVFTLSNHRCSEWPGAHMPLVILLWHWGVAFFKFKYCWFFRHGINFVFHLCCCSVTKSWSPPCDLMNSSIPGFPVIAIAPSLFKFMSFGSVMPSNYLILCCPFSSRLQSLPASGSFPMNWFFTSGEQSIGSLASSVLAMNIQGWFQNYHIRCYPRLYGLVLLNTVSWQTMKHLVGSGFLCDPVSY